MFAAVWGWNKCTLPYLVALVETCSLAHGSSCEHELGFTSPFTWKMNGDFKKISLFICWIQAWLGFHCVGIKAPGRPPSTLFFVALLSSEPLLANFKEFTSKLFGRHRTARLRLEFPASAEWVKPQLLGEPSSLFLLFTRAKRELLSWGAWRRPSPLT